jgi:hypothetical protein
MRQCFASRVHKNALHDPQIPPDAKTPVRRNVSSALFMETAPGPPEHEKECVDFLNPERTEMHYVTRKSYQMQK